MEKFYCDVFWPSIDAEGGVKEILCLGDVTDRRKFLQYQTLKFAKQMFFDPARDRGIKVHWVLGNHDLPFKHSLQLSSHEAFKEYANVQVYRDATVVPFNGVPVLLMPWLCGENIDSSFAAAEQFDGSVIAGHFEFGGFDVYRGFPMAHGLDAGRFAGFPLVMSGHYHHPSTKGNVHYLGSPYEMVWTDYGDARGFHWWTPTTHQLELVENPHHLFYKFVYDDAGQPGTYVQTLLSQMKASDLTQKIVKVLVRQKTQPVWYEAFADAVLRMGIHDVHFVDDTSAAAATSTDEHTGPVTDTLTMIHRYVGGLPWANTALQHDVTSVMTELFLEATDHAKTVGRN